MDATMTWVILFVGIIERLLRLWMVEDDPERITETSGKNVYLWSSSILLIISVVSLFFLWEHVSLVFIWITFTTVFLIFRAFMEWRYIREEREHIVTLMVMVIQGVCFLVFVS